MVPPVLHSLVDQDARVRYYACEALYNIAKVARDDFMPHFPDTFDALFRLCADHDSAVHQATTFLDNLMKASFYRLCCDVQSMQSCACSNDAAGTRNAASTEEHRFCAGS